MKIDLFKITIKSQNVLHSTFVCKSVYLVYFLKTLCARILKVKLKILFTLWNFYRPKNVWEKILEFKVFTL